MRNRVPFCIIVILKMHIISYELQGHRIHISLVATSYKNAVPSGMSCLTFFSVPCL